MTRFQLKKKGKSNGEDRVVDIKGFRFSQSTIRAP